MNDKLSKITNSNINSINTNKKKILIENSNETSILKVISVNCILDFKSFVKNNFQDSKKGYIGLSLIAIYILNRKRPFIYSIKNNYEFSNSLISRNKIIKVCQIISSFEKKSANSINPNNFKFTYSLEYRHINAVYNKLSNLKILASNILNKNRRNDKTNNFDDKIINENKNNNSETSYEKKELEILTGIDVKLCGIKDINEEGKKIAEKLISDKNSKIFLQFNHILYMDSPEIYCWIYIKNRKISVNKFNLNIFLVKQGLANVNPVKLNEIYDERIYYNYSDLLDAERNSKEMGLGIWSNKRSKVIRESSIKNEGFGSIFERFGKRLNMRGWEKSILNK